MVHSVAQKINNGCRDYHRLQKQWDAYASTFL